MSLGSYTTSQALPNITLTTPLADKTFGDVANYFQPQINGGFVLISAYLVFFMHAGFCMVRLVDRSVPSSFSIFILQVEVGCVRAKNAKNTVIMTLLDAAFAAIGWWLTGFAFAFGDPLSAGPMRSVIGPGNGFIGYKYFVLTDYPGDMWPFWLFQYAVRVVDMRCGHHCRTTTVCHHRHDHRVGCRRRALPL